MVVKIKVAISQKRTVDRGRNNVEDKHHPEEEFQPERCLFWVWCLTEYLLYGDCACEVLVRKNPLGSAEAAIAEDLGDYLQDQEVHKSWFPVGQLVVAERDQSCSNVAEDEQHT